MLDLGDLVMSKKTLCCQSHDVYGLVEETDNDQIITWINGKVYPDGKCYR